MNCDSYIELMSAALDGECTPDKLRRLEEHLAQCPSCAQLYRRLSANARAARELDCEMPEDLKQRILSSLPPQDAPAKAKKSRLLKILAPVAAAACLVLVIAGTAPGVFDTAAGGNAGSNDCTGSTDIFGSADAQCSAEYTPGSGSTTDAPGSDHDGSLSGFTNPQAIRVSYGATPEAPSAIMIGSVESLANYLGQFESLCWDENGNVVPIEELETLSETYSETFFGNHRLLCVVVEAPSGSYIYKLAEGSLTANSITVLEIRPEHDATADMAAWLLIAEVDGRFEDGAVLAVILDTGSNS